MIQLSFNFHYINKHFYRTLQICLAICRFGQQTRLIVYFFCTIQYCVLQLICCITVFILIGHEHREITTGSWFGLYWSVFNFCLSLGSFCVFPKHCQFYFNFWFEFRFGLFRISVMLNYKYICLPGLWKSNLTEQLSLYECWFSSYRQVYLWAFGHHALLLKCLSETSGHLILNAVVNCNIC